MTDLDIKVLLDECSAQILKNDAMVRELAQENDTLRGLLAKGQADCVYCGLPAADIAKCKSGFPGCSRMDDIVNAAETESEKRLQQANLKLAALRLKMLALWFMHGPDPSQWHPITAQDLPQSGDEVGAWEKSAIQAGGEPEFYVLSVGNYFSLGERNLDPKDITKAQWDELGWEYFRPLYPPQRLSA